MGAAALHMQARATLHDGQPDLAFADASIPIARAAAKAQTDLRAMSRFCLQNLLSRSQGLMVQIAAVAQAAQDLTPAVAAELDRCSVILRGHSRAAPRGADMLRWSEQRLWGALAAELHRLEGTDGPVMRACAQIEVIAFDLATASASLLDCRQADRAQTLPLAQRRELATALILAATGIARSGADPQRARTLAQAISGPLPAAGDLLHALQREFGVLHGASQQIAAAIFVASQVSAQSMATTRLEHDMQELDRLLTELATSYRAAKGHRDGGDGLRARLARDAPAWRDAARAMAIPLALSQNAIQPPGPARLPGDPFPSHSLPATV